MKTKQISNEDALAISIRDEDHFFDRKAMGIQPKKIEKIAVAFANADGGDVYIGIADDSDEPDPEKRWNGASDIEEFNSYFQSLSSLSPSIDFKATFLKNEEKPGIVLHLQIDKSQSVHKTSDNTVYVRLSAQSIPYKDPQKILELSFAKGSTSFEDELVKSTRIEKITNSSEMKRFLGEVSPSTDPLEFVVNQNLIDEQDFEPRVAGILLFSDNPSALMPRKCAVKIARYETREEEPERDNLKDTWTMEGPLYQQINQTIVKVTEIMSSVKIWTVEGLKNVSYPPEAISEIITNALIHRDYSISDDVQIYIFNNRIEVFSPGRLPGNVTTDNILDVRYARNSKIVRTLNRYKNPPNKDMGEGLNTAFQKMREWRLSSPQIIEENNGVKVTIPHTSLASPEEAILEFLKHNDMIRNGQARELTGVRSENSMKNIFYRLRDEGLIERVQGLEGPLSAWQLKNKL